MFVTKNRQKYIAMTKSRVTLSLKSEDDVLSGVMTPIYNLREIITIENVS